MSETPPAKPKAPKAQAAPVDPAEALKTAIANLVTAADAYAASDTGRTTHSFTAGGYRVRYMGEQFLGLMRL